MIQLSFQPSLDPFHCIFRLLRLRPTLRTAGPLPVETVRILDFYLVFPLRLKDLRTKPEHRKLKTAALKSDLVEPYSDQPNDQILLDRMKAIQDVALETTASNSLIRGEALDNGLVEVLERPLPVSLVSRIEEVNERERPLVEFLAVLAKEYELIGRGGLKERSKLMEYRYDAA